MGELKVGLMAVSSAGSNYVADGITSVPSYAYTPPAFFFETGTPPAGQTYDIRDFGAIEGAGINNQPMIQAAIDAAAEAGGGVVYIPPGVWGVAVNPDGYGSIHLADNVFLKGAGMGASTVRLMDGSSVDITGIIRTTWGESTANTGLADLSIDGNKANTTGKVDGFYTGPLPGSPMRDSDIQVLRVEIHDVSRYGFDPHEQTERLSIKDSVAHHNGIDGFVLDYNVDAEISGNISYENGRHGFNLVTTSHDILMTDNVAHSNGGAGIVVQRGSEDIESSHSVTIQGGASWGNGREGVLIQMSHDVIVSDMEIHGNGREGIRVSGSSNVTIEGNTLHGNSASLFDGYSAVTILAQEDKVYGRIYEANDVLVEGNIIDATGARYGVEERAGSTSGNVIADNDVTGGVRGPLAVNGTDSWSLISGSDLNDTLVGTATKDQIIGGAGLDSLSGQDGNDLLLGGAGNDRLVGGKGDDRLEGGADNDTLNGNTGNDRLFGDDGNDSLVGDAGNDVLSGGNGNDTVSGGTGADRIYIDAGDDVLNGGSDFDTLDLSTATAAMSVDLTARTATGMGRDSVSSFEAVFGSSFADIVRGDRLANVLDGGAGDDVLRGMGGADTLKGGAGNDTFVWGGVRDVVDSGVYLGLDAIDDFVVGQDVLDVRALVAGRTWSQLSDIVQVKDGLEGSILSVNIGGSFYDVAHLEGIHGFDATQLLAEYALLV